MEQTVASGPAGRKGLEVNVVRRGRTNVAVGRLKSAMSDVNRELTDNERHLVRWMLEYGSPEAVTFLPQLELAQVMPWRCPCGCASIQFRIRGKPEAQPGAHAIAMFVFDEENTLSGIFVYENDGILSGLEVYGFTGEPPKCLPEPETLRPFASELTA